MFIFANCFTIAAEKPTIKANSPVCEHDKLVDFHLTAALSILLLFSNKHANKEHYNLYVVILGRKFTDFQALFTEQDCLNCQHSIGLKD